MPYYHVHVGSTLGWPYDERRYNANRQWILDRIQAPRAAGEPITINGKTIPISEISRINVRETDRQILESLVEQAERSFRLARDVTDEFINAPPGSALATNANDQQGHGPSGDTREVFVVHGRNQIARNALFDFLRSLSLHPLEWSEAVSYTNKPMPYIGEILDAAFDQAHAVVVLLTPDDEARLREPFRDPDDPQHEVDLTGQARPNVLFEAGMAMSRSEERTILVELGSLRPFSDVAGRHTIKMDNSPQRRQELAQRLASAGCPVNLRGTHWQTAGDFEKALEFVHDIHPVQTFTALSFISGDAKKLLISAVQQNGGVIKPDGFGPRFRPLPRGIIEYRPGLLGKRLLDALGELVEHGLVSQGPSYEVTSNGYTLSEQIENERDS